MFGVESMITALERIWNGIARRFCQRSAGRAFPVQLLPPFADAESLPAFQPVCHAQLPMNQPECLCKKSEQQQPGKKLRAAEAFAREIWAHRVEPSVLPCRRLLRGKFCDE